VLDILASNAQAGVLRSAALTGRTLALIAASFWRTWLGVVREVARRAAVLPDEARIDLIQTAECWIAHARAEAVLAAAAPAHARRRRDPARLPPQRRGLLPLSSRDALVGALSGNGPLRTVFDDPSGK
jgi:hypothetical protein